MFPSVPLRTIFFHHTLQAQIQDVRGAHTTRKNKGFPWGPHITKRNLKFKRWTVLNSPNLTFERLIWPTLHSNVRTGSLTLQDLRCCFGVNISSCLNWQYQLWCLKQSLLLGAKENILTCACCTGLERNETRRPGRIGQTFRRSYTIHYE